MKKKFGLAVSLPPLCVAPALSEGETRELGAYEHGHSSVNLAIEGEEHEASHNEFRAAYAMTCSSPDALDGIDFAAFFDAFDSAQEIAVTVISEKGQFSYEVGRDAPVMDLQRIV